MKFVDEAELFFIFRHQVTNSAFTHLRHKLVSFHDQIPSYIRPTYPTVVL